MNSNELVAKLKESRKLAEEGDAHAAYIAAVLSLNSRDYQAVFHYAKLAYQLSDGGGEDAHEALNLLGDLYEYGRGCEKDLAKAAEIYAEASKLGNDESQFRLGAMYLTGSGVGNDIDKALELLEKSAAAGNDKGLEYWGYAKILKKGFADRLKIIQNEEPSEKEPREPSENEPCEEPSEKECKLSEKESCEEALEKEQCEPSENEQCEEALEKDTNNSNVVQDDNSPEEEPYMVLTLLGQRTEFNNDREYFAKLSEDVEQAKNDLTNENIYQVKENAIQGMNFYFRKRDISNNELIYNNVKQFAVSPDCDDYNLVLMDWTIENSYGMIRCAAHEKEGLDNITASVALMEQLYKISPDEAVKQQLIKQYYQAEDMFKRFNDIEGAEKFARLADTIQLD